MTFFHLWEEKLWGDYVDANENFATLTIWLTLIITAAGVCVSAANSMSFNGDILMQGVTGGLGMVGLCWLFDVAESIVACKNVSTVFKRSFLLLATLIGAAAIGILLSVVIIVIVCIVFGILVIYLVGGLLSGSLSTPSRRLSKNRDDEQDMEQTNWGKVKKSWESMDGHEMTDTHGRHYSRSNIFENYKRDDN